MCDGMTCTRRKLDDLVKRLRLLVVHMFILAELRDEIKKTVSSSRPPPPHIPQRPHRHQPTNLLTPCRYSSSGGGAAPRRKQSSSRNSTRFSSPRPPSSTWRKATYPLRTRSCNGSLVSEGLDLIWLGVRNRIRVSKHSSEIRAHARPPIHAHYFSHSPVSSAPPHPTHSSIDVADWTKLPRPREKDFATLQKLLDTDIPDLQGLLSGQGAAALLEKQKQPTFMQYVQV